jgi:hypothetical protein
MASEKRKITEEQKNRRQGERDNEKKTTSIKIHVFMYSLTQNHIESFIHASIHSSMPYMHASIDLLFLSIERDVGERAAERVR